jgi:hypothetical protein
LWVETVPRAWDACLQVGEGVPCWVSWHTKPLLPAGVEVPGASSRLFYTVWVMPFEVQ